MEDLNKMSLDEMESELMGKDPDEIYADWSNKSQGDDQDQDQGKDKDQDKDQWNDQDWDQGKGEDGWESKKEPSKNIKKLLNQRNEAREEVKNLKDEVKKKDERIKKLENWELDDEFKDEDWEVDEVKRDRALIKAENEKLIIERELSKSTKDLDNERNQKLAEFIDKNPDLSEIKDDIKAYAEKHQEMDIDDIATLIIAKSDPLKLLDEQTKNKLKGGYWLGWKDKSIDNNKKGVENMSDEELESELTKQYESKWF